MILLEAWIDEGRDPDEFIGVVLLMRKALEWQKRKLLRRFLRRGHIKYNYIYLTRCDMKSTNRKPIKCDICEGICSSPDNHKELKERIKKLGQFLKLTPKERKLPEKRNVRRAVFALNLPHGVPVSALKLHHQ